MNVEKKLQEDQYLFPYHYIPEINDDSVSFVKYWGWGLQYLGRIELIQEILSNIEYDTLLDVGCGDGRLINILSKKNKEINYLGVDYSEQAINFAKLLNYNSDNTEFISQDITIGLKRKFDVITMIEVLEHIEPNNVSKFLGACVDHLNNDGFFIITVPSKNLPKRKRHFQHFDKETLTTYLYESGLKVEQCEYIDSRGTLLKIFRKLLSNRFFVVNSNYLSRKIFEFYKANHLRADRATGEGIYAVCRKV